LHTRRGIGRSGRYQFTPLKGRIGLKKSIYQGDLGEVMLGKFQVVKAMEENFLQSSKQFGTAVLDVVTAGKIL